MFGKERNGIARQDGNMVLTVWQDTKAYTIMSTQHDLAVIATVKRKKGDGSKIDVTCPQSIIGYNGMECLNYMCSVTLQVHSVY